MEKTREFIRIHLQPIIDLENEGTETSIIFKEEMVPHLELIMRKNESKYSVNVLEIGFGAGFAAVYFLFTNLNLRITCIDEGYHRYSYACFEKIREHFGEDRIRFYLGNSNAILPLLKEKHKSSGFISELNLHSLVLKQKSSVIDFEFQSYLNNEHGF